MPVFISFSDDSQRVCDELRRSLESAGIESWNADSMQVGGRLADQLRNAIDTCQLCIFIASERSLNSGWCKAEIGAFWGARKPVLIYEHEAAISRGEVPSQFAGTLWTSDRERLLDGVKQELFAAGCLPSSPQRGGAVAILSMDQRDADKRAVIESSIRAAGLSDRVAMLQHSEIVMQDEFDRWSGLFLGMPYRQRLSPGQIDRIVRWVRGGGKLVFCGFELGQWHHETNVNQLGAEFGIQFRSDVVVGEDGATVGKQYGAPHRFTEIADTEHALLKNVSELRLANACSLYLEPGSRPMVMIEPNQINDLEPSAAIYSAKDDFYVLASGEQRFRPSYRATGRAVMAEGPAGLSGSGAVVGIGTWHFAAGQDGNTTFLRNVFEWLATRAS